MYIKNVIVDATSQAELTMYINEESSEMPQRTIRPAILIFPGGGYGMVSDRENEPVARAFWASGFQVFVLRYSILEKARNMQPLLEAAQAMQYIRTHAKELYVDETKIAVCGFSAGGHLAGSLGVMYKKKEVLERLNVLPKQIRPDALVLAYPVITSGEFAHRGSFFNLTGSAEDSAENRVYSLEQYIDEETPTTFIWHATDDCAVPVENTLLFIQNLQRNKVAYEAHLFEKGGHGISMCNQEVGSNNPHCAYWYPLCVEWLCEKFQFSL